MGYVQQSREEMEVVFTLLAERYERGSVLLTSSLPFSKWEGIFKDAMTTVAAIDRLVHHCVILDLNIPSYRMEQANVPLFWPTTQTRFLEIVTFNSKQTCRAVPTSGLPVIRA